MLNNDNDLQFDISVATSNPKNYIEPHVWTTSAKHLHERVQHLFVKSKALRSEIKKEKVNVDERMMRQEGRVNKRLRDRLLQYKSALAENRKLLRITNAEISRTKREMKTLSSEIDGKELPLKRATTALLKRSARIGAEQTRDKVHLSLIEEVKDMEAAISALSSALQGNNHTLADLFNAKAMLEEDITIKSNSIRIEEKCIKLRSYFSKLSKSRSFALSLGYLPIILHIASLSGNQMIINVEVRLGKSECIGMLVVGHKQTYENYLKLSMCFVASVARCYGQSTAD
eukprot:UC4_evm3s804